MLADNQARLKLALEELANAEQAQKIAQQEATVLKQNINQQKIDDVKDINKKITTSFDLDTLIEFEAIDIEQ